MSLRFTLREPMRALLTAALAATLTLIIVLHPKDAFNASLEGLRLWWDVVFPALLPFFIASEILMALGVVHFMGALLEPLMQPLFHVPGVGGFVIAMGLASGYPIGAKITSQLRRKNMLDGVEAERLISFTNTADPLFMVGAVAVGMFKDQALGGIIVAAHYLSSLLLGLIMRFHGPYRPRREVLPYRTLAQYFRHAVDELYRARQADGRPLGQLLGDAIRESVNTLLLIGGFIILFSVLVRMLTLTGWAALFTAPLGALLRLCGFQSDLLPGLLGGTLEITLGCHLVASAAAPLLDRLMLVGAVIAWSGLSVHGQVAALISSTDIRYWPYLLARLLHAALAAALTLFLSPALATLAPSLEPWPPSSTAALPLPLAVAVRVQAALASCLLLLALAAAAALFGQLRRRIVISL
ncbi:MAG: sporulation integral membrane protein YlbJ [Bacillota bacterium]|nr:sporulation integral membrane protein YlbJ [Bacillota bacterium]